MLYTLTVADIHEETADAKSLILVAKPEEEALFDYRPGQFLSFELSIDQSSIMRSYSISSLPGSEMRVCVKRVPGGLGSNWLNDHAQPGTQLRCQRPAGSFTLRTPNAPALLFSGGSGITPCLSLLKQLLLHTEQSVKLLYANRDAQSIIYKTEIAQLCEQFPDRFECNHWLDAQTGYLSSENIASFIQGWENADTYICGPTPMMDLVEDTVAACFGEQAIIVSERFISPTNTTNTQTKTQDISALAPSGVLTLKLDGHTHDIPYACGETLLDACLRAGVDAPKSCCEGHCGSCLAALKNGEVSMENPQALSKRNIRQNKILLCQAIPNSGITAVEVDMDF